MRPCRLPPVNRRAWLGTLLLAVAQVSCGREADGNTAVVEPWIGTPQVVLAERPPFSAGTWPCSDCHEPDLPTRTTPRKLETAHQELALRHGPERMWCFDCHDVKNRDRLRIAGGALVDFEEAHVLCAQCHAKQHRDWQNGAHGLRTGSWAGTMVVQRCVHCHDAHAPRFKPLQPMPAPKRPERTR